MLSDEARDELGKLVREEWVRYCREIGDKKPSHLMPWEDLGGVEQEADRRIGEAVLDVALKMLEAEVATLRKRLGEAEAERDIAVVNREQAYRLNSAANLREQAMADKLDAADQWMRELAKMAADEIAAEKGDS